MQSDVESKTFEYTIIVIHEYLSLINDLEILGGVKEYLLQTQLSSGGLSWIELIKN